MDLIICEHNRVQNRAGLEMLRNVEEYTERKGIYRARKEGAAGRAEVIEDVLRCTLRVALYRTLCTPYSTL